MENLEEENLRDMVDVVVMGQLSGVPLNDLGCLWLMRSIIMGFIAMGICGTCMDSCY